MIMTDSMPRRPRRSGSPLRETRENFPPFRSKADLLDDVSDLSSLDSTHSHCSIVSSSSSAGTRSGHHCGDDSSSCSSSSVSSHRHFSPASQLVLFSNSAEQQRRNRWHNNGSPEKETSVGSPRQPRRQSHELLVPPPPPPPVPSHNDRWSPLTRNFKSLSSLDRLPPTRPQRPSISGLVPPIQQAIDEDEPTDASQGTNQSTTISTIKGTNTNKSNNTTNSTAKAMNTKDIIFDPSQKQHLEQRQDSSASSSSSLSTTAPPMLVELDQDDDNDNSYNDDNSASKDIVFVPKVRSKSYLDKLAVVDHHRHQQQRGRCRRRLDTLSWRSSGTNVMMLTPASVDDRATVRKLKEFAKEAFESKRSVITTSTRGSTASTASSNHDYSIPWFAASQSVLP